LSYIFAIVARFSFKSLATTQITAGDSVVLTIQVLDGSNQVLVSEERDVSLSYSASSSVAVSGAATQTSAGVVRLDIQRGQAIVILRDLVAESVTFSFSDTSTTGFDISQTLTLLWRPGIANYDQRSELAHFI
jgi:hypothetical protein